MTDTTTAPTIKDKVLGIPDEQKITPTIPVDIVILEAENLYHFAKDDKETLVESGLNTTLIEDLLPRITFLQDCQAAWMTVYNGKEITLEEWKKESEKAYELQAELLHSFRFAFRNEHKLTTQVNRIAEGSGHADLIQDLKDYASLGKANKEALEAINFDMQKLDLAITMSNSLLSLLGEVNGIRKDAGKLEKELRDRAYTYLKQAVDEIRDYGKYAFWKEEDKVKLYSSDYSRKIRERNS
ncbi:hypothetical protein [Ancylomarina longa]|uniref:Uncharacterized protein n=1 Tax=Ancylomarina longa TaxID=2487017 RepID=A0A434AYP8_9BACT|nr:hypothetical protein [Ancylomarina longa]RUT79703.1 hypothetical protein DLK05_03190 [Ancylomarina longa]